MCSFEKTLNVPVRQFTIVDPGVCNVNTSLRKAVQVVLRAVIAGQAQTEGNVECMWRYGRIGSEPQSSRAPWTGTTRIYHERNHKFLLRPRLCFRHVVRYHQVDWLRENNFTVLICVSSQFIADHLYRHRKQHALDCHMDKDQYVPCSQKASS